MTEQVKYLEVKGEELILNKRKELRKLGAFNCLGPADCCFMFYSKEGSFLSKK